jgi:hypothetical protein
MNLEAEDNDDDYEEVLVFVKFEDFENCGLLDKASSVSINDLDKHFPVCQVTIPDTQFTFKGEHSLGVGTTHIFQKYSDEVSHVGHCTTVTSMKLKHFESVTTSTSSEDRNS